MFLHPYDLHLLDGLSQTGPEVIFYLQRKGVFILKSVISAKYFGIPWYDENYGLFAWDSFREHAI